MESAENQAQSTSGQKSESNLNPPLSRTETIALLNDSIDRLEETIKKISEDSAKIPSSDSINSLVTTTQELEDAVTPGAEATKLQAKSPASQSTAKVPQPSKSNPKNRQNNPRASSAKAPAPQVQKKQNLVLIVVGVTAISIAIVTVFWLWKPQLISNLLTQAEPLLTEVRTNLDQQLEQPIAISGQPAATSLKDPLKNLDDPEQPEKLNSNNSNNLPVEIAPIAKPAVEPVTESAEELAEEVEAVMETIIPSELTSPGKPKNLKMVTIKPELNLTPEQSLIAILESKLKKLAQDYPPELIQAIQVNFSDDSLLVEVTDSWYELEELRQNSLGNEMLQRSRAFSFDKLQLKDKEGNLIARNPIIGENLIILQHKKQQLAENLTEETL